MLLIFLITTGNFYSQESDIQILEKTIAQLNALESAFYTATTEGNESNITYINDERSIYFDFVNSPKNTTPRYYIKNKGNELIYDGKKHIQAISSEKLIVTGGSINPNNPLLMSLYSIKEVLPYLIDNENVTITRVHDITISDQENYIFELLLNNSVIDWEKLVLKSTPKTTSNYNKYTLIVNKSDYFPRKMIMPNGPTGTLSSTISDLDLNYKINTQLWTGTLMPPEYTSITFDEYIDRLQAKSISPSKSSANTTKDKYIEGWKIPNIENDVLVDFSKLKGNVILLEFWFKFCGPCVKAVPKLNAMQQKYKNDAFLIYGIEFLENFPKENLKKYASLVQMEYPVLYKGKKIANTFEIGAAPTFMIINKEGKIIYLQSGFNQEMIEKIIKENL